MAIELIGMTFVALKCGTRIHRCTTRTEYGKWGRFRSLINTMLEKKNERLDFYFTTFFFSTICRHIYLLVSLHCKAPQSPRAGRLTPFQCAHFSFSYSILNLKIFNIYGNVFYSEISTYGAFCLLWMAVVGKLNPYQVLGVKRNAPLTLFEKQIYVFSIFGTESVSEQKEIKKAYRNLSLK